MIMNLTRTQLFTASLLSYTIILNIVDHIQDYTLRYRIAEDILKIITVYSLAFSFETLAWGQAMGTIVSYDLFKDILITFVIQLRHSYIYIREFRLENAVRGLLRNLTKEFMVSVFRYFVSMEFQSGIEKKFTKNVFREKGKKKLKNDKIKKINQDIKSCKANKKDVLRQAKMRLMQEHSGVEDMVFLDPLGNRISYEDWIKHESIEFLYPDYRKNKKSTFWSKLKAIFINITGCSRMEQQSFSFIRTKTEIPPHNIWAWISWKFFSSNGQYDTMGRNFSCFTPHTNTLPFHRIWLKAFCNVMGLTSILSFIQMYDSLFSLCLLIAQIKRNPNPTDITLATLSFCQAEFKGVWTDEILHFIMSEQQSFVEQSGMEAQFGLDEFLSSIKAFRSVQKSPVAKYSLTLLALLVSSGLAQALGMTYNVNGLGPFVNGLIENIKMKPPSDILDLILDTVTYFLETGAMCFKYRSLQPFMYTKPEAMEFDERYLAWCNMHKAVMTADWDHADINTYESEYRAIYDYYKTIYATVKNQYQGTLLFRRMEVLSAWFNEYKRESGKGGIRTAPYTMLLYGSSSVGKTTVGQILNVHAVLASGGSGSLDRVAVFNEDDKYFSNYQLDTETIILDDVANTNPDFLDHSPVAPLIKFNNNTFETALKADVESKGKIPIRPLTLVVTSNVSDMGAPIYSVEPVSICRRLNCRISVKVKDKFKLELSTSGKGMIDPQKVANYESFMELTHGANSPQVKYLDVWDLTVEVCKPVANVCPSLPDGVAWVPVNFRGEPLVDASLQTVCEYITDDATRFRQNQVKIVNRQKNLQEKYSTCFKCKQFPFACGCHQNVCADCDNYLIKCKCGMSAHSGSGRVEFDDSLHNRDIDSASDNDADSVSDVSQNSVLSCPIWTWVNIAIVSIQKYWNDIFKDDFIEHQQNIELINSAVNNPSNYFRNNQTKVFGGVVVVSVVLTLIYYYKFVREMFQNQSGPFDFPEMRRQEPNPWNLFARKCVKGNEGVINNRVPSELLNRISKSNVFVRSNGYYSNGFYLKSSYLMLPLHFMQQVGSEGVLHVQHPTKYPKARHELKVVYDSNSVFEIPECDMAIVFVVGGPRMDFTEFLARTPGNGKTSAITVFTNRNGEQLRDTCSVTFGDVRMSPVKVYKGGHLEYVNTTTFRGQCMAPILLDCANPVIIGFHMAGYTDTIKGGFYYLPLEKIEQAKKFFETKGFVSMTEQSEVPDKQYELQKYPCKTTDEVHRRCPSNFVENGSFEIIGAYDALSSPTTCAEISFISETVEQVMKLPRIHEPPVMVGPGVPRWKHWSKAFQGLCNPAKGPTPKDLLLAKNDYLKPLVHKIGKLEVLDHATTVNGLDGDRWYNRMPLSTSVGYPLNGPLSKYVVKGPSVEGHNCCYDFDDPSIMEAIGRYELLLEKGKNINTIFRASLKDEAVKIGKDKVRVFQAAPLALKYLMRKYFLPISSFLSDYPIESECCVGINAFSVEWDCLMKEIGKYGRDRIVAGDYSAYDQRLPQSVVMTAFSILLDLAERAGYDERQLKVMRGLAAEVMAPLIAYNGTLVRFYGSNPSGQTLTVYINSICNSLLSRCAFINIVGMTQRYDFRTFVSMTTYGDDDIGSVRLNCDYNCATKQKYLESIEMVYTAPDKSDRIKEYYDLKDVDFLKRQDVWSVGLQHSIGQLSLASISKSLHVRMKTAHVTDAEWAGQVIDGALHELFAHGMTVYEERRRQLEQVVAIHGLEGHVHNLKLSYHDMAAKISSPSSLVTDCMYEFDMQDCFTEEENLSVFSAISVTENLTQSLSNSNETTNSISGDIENGSILQGPDSPITLDDFSSFNLNNEGDYPSQQSSRRQSYHRCYSWDTGHYSRDGFRRHPSMHSWYSDSCPSCNSFDPPRVHHIEYQPATFISYESHFGEDLPPAFYDDKGQLIQELFDIYDYYRQSYFNYYNNWGPMYTTTDFTGAAIRMYQNKYPKWVPRTEYMEQQSGDISREEGMEGNEVQAIIKYSDNVPHPSNAYNTDCDDSYYYADKGDVSLSEFFARPILLGSIPWTVNAPFPNQNWTMASYLTNKRIVNRMSNYKLVKADFCVRLLVNGTPFHYGSILAFANPFEFNDFFVTPTNVVSMANLVCWSQKPHVYLEPTTSTGGCLRLPYISPYNSHDITSIQTALYPVVYLAELVRLRHVSLPADKITISIYVWMENVVLSAPTGVTARGMVAQSGQDADDEYNNGPIERVANVVAGAAGLLSNTIGIGKYALATQLAAKGVASVARVFGMSKPTLVHDLGIMVPRPHQNLASATQLDPCYKLTLDEKQEVTIDPRVAGFSAIDEMGIVTIAKKESFLTVFLYDDTKIPNTNLFNIKVSPTLHVTPPILTPSVDKLTYMTPVCWVSRPFRYWRGTMRYRFRAHCSSFHRGRLRIAYEPTAAATASATEHNLDRGYIWDLAESKEAVIDVGWHSGLPYLTVRNYTSIAADYDAFDYGVAPLVNTSVNHDNGKLSVFVLNELAEPGTGGSNTGVSITVHVSATDDFQVFDPYSEEINKYSYYTMQSGSDMDNTLMTPVAAKADYVFGPRCESEGVDITHHGDPVLSIRTLLKRYTNYMDIGVESTTANPIIRAAWPAFPLQPGRAPNAIHLKGTGINWVHMTYLAYFTPSYIARRGGLRIKLNSYGPDSTKVNPIVARAPPLFSNGNAPNVIGTGNANTKIAFQSLNVFTGITGQDGSVLPFKTLDNQHGFSFEIPFHHNARYALGHICDPQILSGTQGFKYVALSTGPALVTYNMYVSAADDFSLQGWSGVNPMRIRIGNLVP